MLTNLDPPESLESIGPGAFSNCPGLTEVRLPAGLQELGELVFGNCPALTLTVVPGSPAEQYCLENHLRYVCSD